jgi:hypothetical protein
MPLLANVLALLLFVMAASAQTAPSNEPTETADEQSGLCPTTHNLESDPSAQYWLEDLIGSKSVRMYLNRGGSLHFDSDSRLGQTAPVRKAVCSLLEAPARGKLFFFGHLKTLVLSAGLRTRRQKNGAT